MKGVLCGAAFATAALVHAAPACERMEYAQLKDSTKSELSGAYCGAMQKVALVRDLRAINERLVARQRALGVDTSAAYDKIMATYDDESACVGAAEAAKGMLFKKFKAKPPSSCD